MPFSSEALPGPGDAHPGGLAAPGVHLRRAGTRAGPHVRVVVGWHLVGDQVLGGQQVGVGKDGLGHGPGYRPSAPLVPRCGDQASARTTRAGTPATSVFGGTSAVTTAPAATTAPSPTVTPGRMLTDAPIHAPSPICTPRDCGRPARRPASPMSCVTVTMVTRGPMETAAPMTMGAPSSGVRMPPGAMNDPLPSVTPRPVICVPPAIWEPRAMSAPPKRRSAARARRRL